MLNKVFLICAYVFLFSALSGCGESPPNSEDEELKKATENDFRLFIKGNEGFLSDIFESEIINCDFRDVWVTKLKNGWLVNYVFCVDNKISRKFKDIKSCFHNLMFYKDKGGWMIVNHPNPSIVFKFYDKAINEYLFEHFDKVEMIEIEKRNPNEADERLKEVLKVINKK